MSCMGLLLRCSAGEVAGPGVRREPPGAWVCEEQAAGERPLLELGVGELVAGGRDEQPVEVLADEREARGGRSRAADRAGQLPAGRVAPDLAASPDRQPQPALDVDGETVR